MLERLSLSTSIRNNADRAFRLPQAFLGQGICLGKLGRLLGLLALLVAFQSPPMLQRVRAQQPEGIAGRSGQSEASLAPGTPILAELTGSLDAKKAKVGDSIAAHTYDNVKSSDGRIILPKGTKLTGRVEQAMARSKGDGESILGIVFEKATLKDGSNVPLLVRVQAIAEPVAFSGMSSPAADTSTLGTNQTSPMGGNSRMGPPSSPPPPGVDDRGDAGGTVSAGLSTQSRGVLGLRGLKLATTEDRGKIVSRVFSDGKNVHLDSGTRLLLVTAATAPEGSPEPPQ